MSWFRKGRLASRFLSSVLLLSAASQSSLAEDWTTFRGSDRSGVSKETGLLDSWPEGGPKLILTATGAGRGYASPAVVGTRMLTLGDGSSTASDADEYLTFFDTRSGEQLWQTKTGPAWDGRGPESWQGSRGTPTVDGDMV